jgi:hypothetical protein
MSNKYSALSTMELDEVYKTTRANYGKIDGLLLDEINRRGGEEAFFQQVINENKLSQERLRIKREVCGLASADPDPEFIKKMIQSDLLGSEELDALVDRLCLELSATRKNEMVDATTWSGAAIGAMAGTVAGFLLTAFQLLYMNRFYMPSLVLIYFLSWLCTRFFTKKDARNFIVLIASVIATIAGPLTAWLVFSHHG